MLKPGMQGRMRYSEDTSALSFGWQTIEMMDLKKLQFIQESHAGRKKRPRPSQGRNLSLTRNCPQRRVYKLPDDLVAKSGPQESLEL